MSRLRWPWVGRGLPVVSWRPSRPGVRSVGLSLGCGCSIDRPLRACLWMLRPCVRGMDSRSSVIMPWNEHRNLE